MQFPWFKHSLSEKALVLLKMGNWDQCTDSVERAFSENSRDIEALRIMILLLLSRDGRAREAAERIRELLETLKRVEPANPELSVRSRAVLLVYQIETRRSCSVAWD